MNISKSIKSNIRATRELSIVFSTLLNRKLYSTIKPAIKNMMPIIFILFLWTMSVISLACWIVSTPTTAILSESNARIVVDEALAL